MFAAHGLTHEQMAPAVTAIISKPDTWVDFMMQFELGLGKPDPSREIRSAATIGGSYIVGGIVPLAPYFIFADPIMGLKCSAIVTLAALFIFGYIKGYYTSVRPLRTALQTTLVGALAATAAFALAKLVS